MSDVTNETPEETAFFESQGANDVPESVIAEQPEEQAQEPAKTEQKPEPKPESKPPVGYVPHQALHEARMESKELRAQIAKMEGRFEEFMRRASTPPEQKADWESDPIGAGKSLQERLDAFERQEQQRQQQSESQRQHQASVQNVMRTYSTMANDYQAKTPEFKDAYNHWMAGLKDELINLGYTDWQQQIEQMEFNIVAKAIQDGANPAERIHAAAKRRGFKAASLAKDGAERFAQLQKGQGAAKSLSQTSGDQEPPLTLQALAEMDDEDFDKNWDRVMKANTRR